MFKQTRLLTNSKGPLTSVTPQTFTNPTNTIRILKKGFIVTNTTTVVKFMLYVNADSFHHWISDTPVELEIPSIDALGNVCPAFRKNKY